MDGMETRNLPIGIQDFEYIRNNGCVYVDKTAYVYRMARRGKPYFLARPRRFGKSLMVSTLRAYFEGRKELFQGLAIASLEKEWVEHPVFHIDLNAEGYTDIESLDAGLDSNLWPLEEKWGANPPGTGKTPAARFQGLIRRAAEKTGKGVVVLIDEYDRPLVQTMGKGQIHEDMLAALKGFYGVLKSADRWLRFVFITGVSKFSRVSIFSDMNQPRDISMEEEFAGICGISEAELADGFEHEIRLLARKNKMAYGEALSEMRKRYNGYRFAPGAETVYNPFSVLNTLVKQTFGYYWFQTGTPTFLIEQVRAAGFDIPDFANGVTAFAQNIDDYRAKGDDPVPLLYQTGYLTIRDYDPGLGEYTLGFPNEEVKYAFLDELLDSYMPRGVHLQGLFAGDFAKDLRKGDVESFMRRLQSLVAAVPYNNEGAETEHHVETVVFLLFTLIGQFVQAEVHSHKGRADVVASTGEAVYVFELKLASGDGGKATTAAMRQIGEKDYMGPYRSSGKRLVKVAAAYDPGTRKLGEPTIQEE
ncbi:MAG: ATP-binding protein [Acidobacteriota bacterium]|nr:ATP-binding protein [Acidobacteriota bacterium]